MRKYSAVVAILLILLAVYIAFTLSRPSFKPGKAVPEKSFSTERALKHVEEISHFPHAVGFPAHTQVREYLVGQLENLGLTPELQQGYTAGDWANYSKAINILARIEGSGEGKALLLLSHYDSNPHSSLGASDAGSGVATILEGLRAYLSQNPKPKNDIIILFTDAEELGLNGADLFVNQHPWAADVGLVLNFEARGSGGPSYMLLETNRGNSKLIKEFIAANPRYPVGNSLAYSIYKLLPNDTDLTVFREDRDIEGFNFAFIDDHHDYHTALDNYARLDRRSLAHQGSYLMPLLQHFSNADLSGLKSLNDEVYFNVPLFRLVAYPYDWIWPIFALALICFLLLLAYGLTKRELQWGAMGKALLPALIVLLANGLIGYFCWPLLLKVYPAYGEILHGFTYNGQLYIAGFVFLTLAVCFYTYRRFRKTGLANLLPGPLLLWLGICGALGASLPGASFFIIPVFGLLAAFLVVLNQKKPNIYVLVMMGVPALWILGPMVQMFPIGLGLKMMVATTLLTSLIFFLLLPVFGSFKAEWRPGRLCFLLFLGFMAGAHFDSGFDEEKPRPTSLVYLLDADQREAQWVTYDRQLSSWTAPYITEEDRQDLAEHSLSSKYGTGFTFAAAAPLKGIDAPQVSSLKDTIIGDERILSLRIIPQRNVNRLEIHTSETPLKRVVVNGVSLSGHYLSARKGSELLTHFISDNSPTELEVAIPAGQPLELILYEASNDLLEHPLFTIPNRPEDQIPKPFVLNDAILVKKTIRFE